MKELGTWLLERLVEPSTWKGLAILAAAGGVTVSPELITQITAVAGAVIGLIDVVRKEDK